MAFNKAPSARAPLLVVIASWLTCAWARRPAPGSAGPVLVDFYVFLGKSGSGGGTAAQPQPPLASVNIAGADNTSGFYRVCGGECPQSVRRGPGWTVPEMRFCRCIAERLVDDLNSDFGALLDNTAGRGPLFRLGRYAEVDAGQHLFDIPSGHKAFYELMEAGEGSSYQRRPEHLTVWIANSVDAGGQSELEGTTLLDQPLYTGKPGAGVLLSGRVPRSGRRLSHEVGHVVGFEHVAGPKASYTYEHDVCLWMKPLLWKMASGPSCEVNIMGTWYDGPYCCPSTSLLQLRARRRGPDCLPNEAQHPREPYCCGKACTHRCPAERPAMTFATSEHRAMLADIFRCWLRLRGEPAPRGLSLVRTRSPSSTVGVRGHSGVVCEDTSDGRGSCDHLGAGIL